MSSNSVEPKRDYTTYDRRYVQLREAGKTGWVDAESANYDIHLRALERVLAAEYCAATGPALDAGCGAGCWSFVLADHGFDVTGVDLSPTAIAWAREKATRRPADAPGSVDFHVASATDLTWLPADHYSFVLDGFLLHCLVGSDRHAYLRQVRRVLADGGTFFVQSFCADDLDAPEWDGWNIDPQSRYRLDEHGVADKYVGTRRSILTDLRDAGFTRMEDWLVPIAGGMLQVACR
jgi:SAM-dependent methyltransferase